MFLMEEFTIRVVFFAKARELVGKASDSITFRTSSLSIAGYRILELIFKKFPQLEQISSNVVIAANEEYVQPEQLIHLENCREFAIIPPLSGG